MIELKTKQANITLKSPTVVSGGGGSVDLSNYYTKDEVNALIPNVEHYATEEYVNESIANIDYSDFAKITDIPDVSGFITEIPSEYVTETELNAKGYLTAHQSLASYSTTTQVQNMINTAIAGITDAEAVNY